MKLLKSRKFQYFLVGAVIDIALLVVAQFVDLSPEQSELLHISLISISGLILAGITGHTVTDVVAMIKKGEKEWGGMAKGLVVDASEYAKKASEKVEKSILIGVNSLLGLVRDKKIDTKNATALLEKLKEGMVDISDEAKSEISEKIAEIEKEFE